MKPPVDLRARFVQGDPLGVACVRGLVRTLVARELGASATSRQIAEELLGEIWELARAVEADDDEFLRRVRRLTWNALARHRRKRNQVDLPREIPVVLDPFEPIENRECRVAVARALKTLSRLERRVVWLRTWRGATLRECARVLRISYHAARTAEIRARAAMREFLRPFDGEGPRS